MLANPPCLDGQRYVREGRCTHPASFWATAWPPYTLALLGGRLRRAGHEVQLVDAAVEPVDVPGFVRRVAGWSPRLVVLSVAGPSRASDLAVIGQLRRAAPRAVIAVLGVDATAQPAAWLGADGAQAAIRGEPELTVDELAAQLATGGPPAPLAGLSVAGEGGVEHGPERAVAADVTALGAPDWSLVAPGRYRLPGLGRPYLSLLTSRGCPHGCSFCTQHLYYGRQVRPRAPAAIAAEAAELAARFGVQDFFLWSECFAADRAHALAVCRALAQVGPLSWAATTRADDVDPELLAAMRAAGCWLIGFGFESGAPEVLAGCGKGHAVETAVRAARWARQAGLVVLGHFIFGLPGETDATAGQTLALALAAPDDLAQF